MKKSSKILLVAGAPLPLVLLTVFGCGSRTAEGVNDSTGLRPETESGGATADSTQTGTSAAEAEADVPTGAKPSAGAGGGSGQASPTLEGGAAGESENGALGSAAGVGGAALVASAGAAPTPEGGASVGGAGGEAVGGSEAGGEMAGGGETAGAAGGSAVPMGCVECEQGYECFEDIDPGRCFKLCDTEAPDVTIETPEEFAALAALDCEVIGRDLEIAGPLVDDLSQLSNIRVIEGGLVIHDTENLEDLSGLEGLVRIEDGVNVRVNASLTDISALAGVDGGEGAVSINDNPLLESLDGLQGFSSPGGILLTNNFALTDLSAFDPEVAGSILFSGNQAFGVLRFEKLHTIDQNLGVLGENACTSLELPALDYVGGGILISGNMALEQIDMGLLTRADGINITSNPALKTMGGLPSLTSVSTDKAIANNQSLPQCEVDEIAARIDCTENCTDNDPSGVCQ